MSKIENILYEMNNIECSAGGITILYRLDTGAKLIVTLLFLITMLSVPVSNLARLILFISYPIILCIMARIKYTDIAKRSLIALPFVFFIGIFNPILDTRPMYIIFGVPISAGWISFISILLRGLIATQAILLLIYTSGFHRICNAMNRLGVPSLLSTQLLLVYRYIFVLMQEALSMHRARLSRSFGKRSYPLNAWGVFIGQLFLRTTAHSRRIHLAMLARGFSGEIPVKVARSWSVKDTVFMVLASIGLIALRLFNLNSIL